MTSCLLCRSPLFTWNIRNCSNVKPVGIILRVSFTDMISRRTVETSPSEVLVGTTQELWSEHEVLVALKWEIRSRVLSSANSCMGHCWWQWDEAIRWLQDNRRWQHKMLFSCCYFLGRLSVLRLLLPIIWFVSFLSPWITPFYHILLSHYSFGLLSTACYLLIFFMWGNLLC